MPSLWDDATSSYTGQDQQPPEPWSLIGMLHSLLGQNAQRGPQEPLVQQDPQTGMAVPYVPPSTPSVSDLAYSMTGAKDVQQAYQAAQRGEYLPAIGQGAYGALQAASLAYPAFRGATAAGPVAREMAEGIPAFLQDESGALRLRRGMLPEIPTFDPNAPTPAPRRLLDQLPALDTPPPPMGHNMPPEALEADQPSGPPGLIRQVAPNITGRTPTYGEQLRAQHLDQDNPLPLAGARLPVTPPPHVTDDAA